VDAGRQWIWGETDDAADHPAASAQSKRLMEGGAKLHQTLKH